MNGMNGKTLMPQIVLFLTMFYSCEYEPSGIYQRSVNEDRLPPEFQVTGFDLDHDTIYLFADRKFPFAISTDREIEGIIFTIDDSLQLNIYTNSGVLSFPFDILKEGPHTFHIQVYTSSGTGSIADNAGVEGYVFSRFWILLVNKSFNPSKRTAVQNGFMKIRWPWYPFSDFKEYVISRKASGEGAYACNTNEYLDGTNVGEGGNYYIHVRTRDNDLKPWDFPELTGDLPVFSKMLSDTEKYILFWSKSKYYNAVECVVLSQSLDNGVTFSEVKVTRNPEDTLFFVPESLFSTYVRYKLRLIPKYYNILYTPENYPLFESQFEVFFILPK
jgi:hypothetical protein